MTDLREQARSDYLRMLVKKADAAVYQSSADLYCNRIERVLTAWDSAPVDRLWPVSILRPRPVRRVPRVIWSRRNARQGYAR